MFHKYSAWLVPVGIMALAVFLRFSHLDWDGLQQTHPDERYILFVASSMRLPTQPGDLLSPDRSPLNPLRENGEARAYPYGHLPLYAMLAADGLLGPILAGGKVDAFDRLTLAGRAFSALCDSLTVLVVTALARRVYGVPAGWLAAAFAGLAVLHVQQAHFATTDSALALFATLTLFFLAPVAGKEQPERRDSLLAGACAGFAFGSKASALPLLLPLTAAHLHRNNGLWRIDSNLVAALAAAGLAFALTNPYALLDLPLYLRAVGTQAALVRGGVDAPFVRQYAGTLPIWYFVQQQAGWGLGLPLTVTAYVGLGWATWQAWSRRSLRGPNGPLLAWVWVMLGVVGTQFAKFPRYMLPVTPALFVFGAGLLAHLPQATRLQWAIRTCLIGLVLLVTGLNALALWQMYARPHPWLAASEWMYASWPPGTVIAVEQGDDALPLDLDSEQSLRAALRFDQRSVDPFSADEDLHAFLGNLADSDYVVLASNRLYGTLPRLEARFPVGAAYYRHLFADTLGFTLERAFYRYPDLFGLALVDDTFSRPGLPAPPGFEETLPVRRWQLGYSDESFTVYDHPLVLVFRNEEHLSADEMEAIIEGGDATGGR